MSFFQSTCSFFPEFHSLVEFSPAGEIIFEGDMRRGREEVFTYAACFCVSSCCVKIDTKIRRLGRKRFLMHMMIECLPETSFPS